MQILYIKISKIKSVIRIFEKKKKQIQLTVKRLSAHLKIYKKKHKYTKANNKQVNQQQRLSLLDFLSIIITIITNLGSSWSNEYQ